MKVILIHFERLFWLIISRQNVFIISKEELIGFIAYNVF